MRKKLVVYDVFFADSLCTMPTMGAHGDRKFNAVDGRTAAIVWSSYRFETARGFCHFACATCTINIILPHSRLLLVCELRTSAAAALDGSDLS